MTGNHSVTVRAELSQDDLPELIGMGVLEPISRPIKIWGTAMERLEVGDIVIIEDGKVRKAVAEDNP